MEIDLPFASSLSTWEQWSGLSLVKARGLELHPDLPHVCGDPSPWANFRYLHTHIIRELGWRWSSGDSKPVLMG